MNKADGHNGQHNKSQEVSQMAGMAKLHFGGVPTGPSVRLLVEAFAERGPGDVIGYPEIEAVIGVEVGTFRFKTVVNAWRKSMRPNLETECVHGTGVRILPENERAGDAAKEARYGIRKIGKAHRKASNIHVERLESEADRNTATFTLRKLDAINTSARQEFKELATALSPPKQLPRRSVTV